MLPPSSLHPEDGGNMVLPSVGILPHHNPKDQDLNFHCHENLKSNDRTHYMLKSKIKSYEM
jgi:hypothetical protein